MVKKTANLTALGAMHTAGIYSDMSLDGPEIGELVVVVDRAKNLPNKKAMGKQNPYCAARLGKEAKKTETDKRGGQTPKWDQELRFTVHESPDYQNLKVSVFSEDKKTELIGETWINLINVLHPGGGQSDGWHSLSMKGKYAGEIRFEITYYDTRPKPEKMEKAEKSQEEMAINATRAAKSEIHNQPVAVSHTGSMTGSMRGPRDQTPIKRRPLPTDPTAPTNSSPSQSTIPDQSQTASSPQSTHQNYQASPQQPSEPRPRADSHIRPIDSASVHHQPRTHQVELGVNRADMQRHNSDITKSQSYTSNSPSIDSITRGELQSIRSSQYEAYRPPSNDQVPQSSPERYDVGDSGIQDNSVPYAPRRYSEQPIEPLHPRSLQKRMTMPSQNDFQTDFDLVTNPHYGTQTKPKSYMEPSHHSTPAVSSYQSEELVQQRPHLYHSRSGEYSREYPRGSGNYNTVQSMEDEQRRHTYYLEGVPGGYEDEQTPSSSYNYPEQYEAHEQHQLSTSSMQPTVEDEDDLAPPPPPVHRNMAPAPLNLRPHREDTSNEVHQTSSRSDYPQGPLPSESRFTHPRPNLSPSIPAQLRPGASESYTKPQAPEDPFSSTSNMSVVIRRSSEEPQRQQAQDNNISTHIDPRYQQTSSSSYSSQPVYAQNTPPRSHHPSPQSYQQPPPYETSPHHRPIPQQENVTTAGSPQYRPHSFANSPDPTSTPETLPIVKPRTVSPSVHSTSTDARQPRMSDRKTPTRKSVSPRPPIPQSQSERRPSSMPFSPDSFDQFNPNMKHHASNSDSTGNTGADARKDDGLDEVNSEGQIVGFDGRVIDPSDHLPIDSWAPEPEPKGTVKAKPPRERIQLGGARELGARKVIQARIVTKPRHRERVDDPNDPIRSAVNGAAGVVAEPNPAPHTRNRLQKRTGPNRPTTSPSTTPTTIGPLALMGPAISSPYPSIAPRSLPPPIPAKVPLDSNSPQKNRGSIYSDGYNGNATGYVGGDGGFSNEDLAALSEEIARIDIGSSPSAAVRARNANRNSIALDGSSGAVARRPRIRWG